jgi:RNA polymerase-binding transcription factor DksA
LVHQLRKSFDLHKNIYWRSKVEEKDLEMAEKMVEQEKESSMAAVRMQLEAEYHEDFDGENCVDCFNPVGSHRLQMGRIRCVHCQTIREKKIAMGIWVEPNQYRPRAPVALPELIELSSSASLGKAAKGTGATPELVPEVGPKKRKKKD